MRWFFLAALAAIHVAACSCDESTAGSGAGGAGGEVRSATGGSGGEPIPDERAPTIGVTEPVPGTDREDPFVDVRGMATDDGGVAALWWTDDDGNRTDIPIEGGTEVPFDFEVPLRPGDNTIHVGAADEAGNDSSVAIEVGYENTPGREPVIEYFVADRPSAERGESVELRWRVSGSLPMTLEIWSLSGPPMIVTDERSVRYPIRRSDSEWISFIATNVHGSDNERLEISVGDGLRIWPSSAVLGVGQRQRLVAENAPRAEPGNPTVEWSAEGGTIESHPIRPETWFVADAPGTYRVTATTTSEATPRTATASIEVVQLDPLRTTFRGVGGRPVAGKGPLVDDDGNVWALSSESDALIVWRPAEGAWFFVQRIERPARLLGKAANGDLYASGGSDLLRLPSGGARWGVVATGVVSKPLRDGVVGADGTVYQIADGLLSMILPGEEVIEPIELPSGVEAELLAFDPAGGLYFAGRSAAGDRVVYHRAADATAWTDTGVVPFSFERNRALVVADGVPALAGDRLLRLRTSGWMEEGGFPACADDDANCGIQDLEMLSDGTLLAVTPVGPVAEATGGFVQLGTPLPSMIVSDRGTLRSIAVAGDDTLYLQGTKGTYRYDADAEAWNPLGELGIPAGTSPNDVLIGADGRWTLAGGASGELDGQYLIYNRMPGEISWSGAWERSDDHWISQVERDDVGGLHLLIVGPGHPIVLSIDEGSGESTVREVPSSLRMSRELRMGVTGQGVIYLGSTWMNDGVYRSLPGNRTWSPEHAFNAVGDFERAPDGALWACDQLHAYRLGSGVLEWEVARNGLREVGIGNCELAIDEQGAIVLGLGSAGVHRLNFETGTWSRLGYGEPSIMVRRLASGGGKLWAIGFDGTLYWLDVETGSWVPTDGWMPPSELPIFEAAPDGSLLVGGPASGLLQGAVVP